MAQGGMVALVVARPGRRDRLQAVVQTLPRIGRVDLADDGSAALRMVMQSAPDLVVLDIDLTAEKIEAVLLRIKCERPRIPHSDPG